jgi:putative tricarboxylic transport membrane protein
MKGPAGQFALSVGILLIGVMILAGAFYLPPGAGYAQVGPGVVPKFVGAGLILLGIALLREVLTGGFRGVDEEAEKHMPMDWISFAWVSSGIILYGLMVERVGFVFASTVLYVLVARSFASRRWLLNVVVGFFLASLVFVIFNYGLGLTLPAGLLKLVLPA